MENSFIPDKLNEQVSARQPMEYMECNICYPDIYYRVQPFVMSVCDQMYSRGMTALNQEMFDQISDNIYMDVSNTYPDLIEYANCREMEANVESMQMYFDRDRYYDRDRSDRDYDRDRRGRYYPRFRRRGLFRDFIDLLLLNELIRRGRYYPYLPYNYSY